MKLNTSDLENYDLCNQEYNFPKRNDSQNILFAKKVLGECSKSNSCIKDIHVTFNPSSDKKEKQPLWKIDQNIENVNTEKECRITPQPSDISKQSPKIIPK